MIYFDNASTRKPFKGALLAYQEISENLFSNPGSLHRGGFDALNKLEEARKGILNLLNLKSYSLVFTSGSTESNNIVLKGIAHKYQNRGKRIISCVSEHPSILKPLEKLKEEGFDVVLLPTTKDGSVDLEALKNALNDQTILVSLMSVNNESGSYNDLLKISELVKKFPKCFFHTDATQAMGKDNLDYSRADLISFSSHKFGGLKGNGGLIFKSNIKFDNLSLGGEQEEGFRPGTVNVAGAYSSYVALKEEYASLKENAKKVREIKDYLISELSKEDEVIINSSNNSSPYILNFSLKRKRASVVLEALSEKGIYVSSVSACSSKFDASSYVLLAMGKDKEVASNPLRLSFSRDSSLEEAKEFVKEFKTIINEVVDR